MTLFATALLWAWAASPPAQVPPRGATVDRESQPIHQIADGRGRARVLLDGALVPGLREAALTELWLQPGAVVPEHTHDQASELLYILAGSGTMILDGKPMVVRAGMAIYIPAGVKHSLTLSAQAAPLRAIQVYTPGGPEQRFKAGPISKE